MNQTSILEEFAIEYGQARPCLSCEGILVPTTSTLFRDYKGVVLTLNHFPILRCMECKHEQVNTSMLLKYVKQARGNYDRNGFLVLECNPSQETP